MGRLHDFPVQVRIPVAWGEMDSFSHVNNIYYFRYFETTRIHFFEGIGLLKYRRERGIGPILAETSCRFIKPVFYPDTLTIGARVTSIGKTSFTMEFRVMSDTAGLAATGDARLVLYDYNTSKKIDIPIRIKTSLSNCRAQLP